MYIYIYIYIHIANNNSYNMNKQDKKGDPRVAGGGLRPLRRRHGGARVPGRRLALGAKYYTPESTRKNEVPLEIAVEQSTGQFW